MSEEPVIPYKNEHQGDSYVLNMEELLNISKVAPEIHCVLDFKGRILFINGAITRILNYSVEEAYGLNIWKVCHQEDMARVIAEIEAGLGSGKKEFEVECRVLSKTGDVRWLNWGLVVKGDRWYVYGRDITENKSVEDRLQILSLVASKNDTGVHIADKDGYTTWVNHSLERLTGYTLAELQGKQLGNIISTDDTDQELILHSRSKAKNKESHTIELYVRKKEGVPIWLSVSNTPIVNAKGEVERQIDLIADITQRKLAEKEMLEAKEKALQLSEAKEMFLSVMSHEIRTPLNAVIGMTHLLLENEPKPSQVNDLKILKFSGENLLNIINDILDFTKIETGNSQLEAIPFSLSILASDIINSLQVNAKKNKSRLNLSYDNRIPSFVLGDKTRLYQILVNLLGNAIKFTKKGVVDLVIELEHEDENEVAVHFEVKDTGIGIPEDKLSYIFESFTQAKTDISRKYGGTGLGLAITRKLLKLYNSEIKVESTEGKGTVFSFTISFSKVSDAQTAGHIQDPTDVFKGKRILIVDDNKINSLIARRILSKWNLVMDFAYNGHEAIDMVMKQHYDLVFMDIKMPGIDGFETTARIRKLPGEYFRTVPVIALTASTLDQENADFKECGMDGYLLKPFKPDEVKQLLMGYLMTGRNTE